MLLPRLLDAAAHAINEYKKGSQLWIAAVDIRDAFMNIPVSGDRFALTAALPPKESGGELPILIFDTLVFGAASSPWALLFACSVWLPAFKGTAKVRCKSDSLSLLYMLMKRKAAKSADLTVIAREFAILTWPEASTGLTF